MTEQFNIHLYLDANSPSGLRWRVPTGTKMKAGDIAGSLNSSNGYWKVKLHGKLYQAHRVVAVLSGVLDTYTDAYDIDHIDGIRSNNSIPNLRKVTRRGNASNMACHRQGSLVGCHWEPTRGKWFATAYLNGKSRFIGRYDTEVVAHNAYLHFLKGAGVI